MRRQPKFCWPVSKVRQNKYNPGYWQRFRLSVPKQKREQQLRSKKQISLKANENSKLNCPNCLKRGKTWANKLWLDLPIFATDWFREWCKFSQPLSEVKQKQSTPRLILTLHSKLLQESHFKMAPRPCFIDTLHLNGDGERVRKLSQGKVV